MNIKKYNCDACNFMFMIRSMPKKKGKLFCPSCGENADVRKIDIKVPRRAWTYQEESLVDDIVTGKKTKYQVAIMTKRTYAAIQKRYEIHIKRRKKNEFR